MFKDFCLNADYANELTDITGNETVPCFFTGNYPMKEVKDIQ